MLMPETKELLWENEKYQKSSKITVNLELAKWGIKYYLISNFLEVSRIDRVLDIGCGYGMTLLLIHQKINSGIGIDVSKTALKIAKIISQKLKTLNLSFKLSDANKLSFSDESFDKIICFDVAEHMIKPQNLFKEINRILVPGGKALIYTNFYGKFCWSFVKEYIYRAGRLEKLWLRDQEVLHLNRFTRNQIERYLKIDGLKHSLVFKNHWLTPALLDLVTLFKLKNFNSQQRDSKKKKMVIEFSNRVTLFSKIQYFLSLIELKLFGLIESEGVFILIEKVN